MVGATFTVAATVNVLRGANTITAFANAQISTAQSKFGGASALFDGTGDYLLAANTSLLGWNTQPYTIEYWCRITALTAQANDDPTIIGNLNPSGQQDYWSFGPDNSGNLTFKYYNGASVTVKDTGTMSTGVWYHCAAVISSNTIKIYLDGVEKASAAISGTPQFEPGYGGLNIGWGNGSQGYNGYLDEVRVSNSARYTANFTPSTTPFVNDSNTLLLLHMNGTNASTYFPDDNGVRSPAGISAIGNAQISTAQSKFGGASAYMDGVTDYLKILNPTALGSGSFTIEMWIYPTAVTGIRVLYDDRTTQNDTSKVLIYTNGTALYYYVSGNVITGTGAIPTANTWYHVALSRSGTTVKMFVNGTQVGSNYTDSATKSNNIYDACLFGQNSESALAGGSIDQEFVGYMDEIRISNSARYTDNFTPSTTPFVNDANTLLLLHCNGTNASTVFTDDNLALDVSPASAATSVNEGSSLTFNVATQNVANQTLYWSVTNAGDFATSTGSFSLTNNAGSFSVTPTADTTTEGAETFQAQVRLTSTSGPIVSSSPLVTINDTSVATKWQAWKDANAFGTWSSNRPYMNAAIHGVQNNQLIGTVGYCLDSSAGNYLIKGFCFDLTNKTWLWGSATTIAAKPNANDWQTKVACQKDSQYGALLYMNTTSNQVVRGYTISNYASCTSSVAPTITFGTATTLNASNNAGTGDGLVLAYASGSRYIAGGRKSNDRLGVQGFTWNGTSLSLEGSNNEWSGAAGAGYYTTAPFLNTGTVTWGMITASSDPNGNLVEINKGGSTGIDGAVTGYYASGKSGVATWIAPITDAASDAKALVVANNGTDAFWTARVASTTSFTTTTAPTLGTAATLTKSSGIPESTSTLLPTPESGKAYLIYRSGGSSWRVYPLTVSGTTVTWGSSESVHNLNDFNVGRVPASYFSATNGNWYLQLTYPGFTLIKLTV